MERDCNFELSTQTGPNWGAISEHTCSKKGYAKLLLFFYIYYFAYAQYNFGGATTTEVSKLVNDIFHILKSGKYKPSPKIPEIHQTELKKILARLTPKMQHVSHIDFMHINNVSFKIMDTSNEMAYHKTVLENMNKKNKRWRKLIKPEPKDNIQFFFNCLRNLLQNHIYVILSPIQHAMVLVGYNKHKFFIKDSAQPDHKLLKEIKYPLRPQHDPYITRTDAYIMEHIPNYWLIWPRFNVSNKPNRFTRLKRWYTGNHIIDITDLNELYKYTSLVIKEINEHRRMSEDKTNSVTSILSNLRKTGKRSTNIATYWNKMNKTHRFSGIQEGYFTPSSKKPPPLTRKTHQVNKNYIDFLEKINRDRNRNIDLPPPSEASFIPDSHSRLPPQMPPSEASFIPDSQSRLPPQMPPSDFSFIPYSPPMPPPLKRT